MRHYRRAGREVAEVQYWEYDEGNEGWLAA
jgi:hypothetical protein